jgi:hypothetical protein
LQEALTGRSVAVGEAHENLDAAVMELEGQILRTFWIIVAKIGGILTPTFVGEIFFFAIVGVFGIWIAIAGLLMAIIFAVISVSLVPAEGDAR